MRIHRQGFVVGCAAALVAGCAHGAGMLPNAAPEQTRLGAGKASFPAQALPVHPIVGEVRRFDGKRPPASWMICDGRALPIEEHRPLYAVLGQSAAPRDPRTGRLLHPNATHFYLPDARPERFVIAVRGVAPTSPNVVNAVMSRRPASES